MRHSINQHKQGSGTHIDVIDTNNIRLTVMMQPQQWLSELVCGGRRSELCWDKDMMANQFNSVSIVLVGSPLTAHSMHFGNCSQQVHLICACYRGRIHTSVLPAVRVFGASITCLSIYNLVKVSTLSPLIANIFKKQC